MKKYVYNYEAVEYNTGMFTNTLSEHMRIINSYAKQGWRYAGWIPIQDNHSMGIGRIHLIFEKEIEE